MCTIVLALGVLAAATPALAHPDGHDRQFRVERKPLSQSARDAVIKLVAQAKLPASWAQIQASNVTPPASGTGPWQVTFENKAIRQPGKQILYVLMTPDGEFISASHKKGAA